MDEASQSVAYAYLALLAKRGVRFLFGNGGTDFAPIIEAYAVAAQKGVPVPQPILATHENLAVSMAHASNAGIAAIHSCLCVNGSLRSAGERSEATRASRCPPSAIMSEPFGNARRRIRRFAIEIKCSA